MTAPADTTLRARLARAQAQVAALEAIVEDRTRDLYLARQRVEASARAQRLEALGQLAAGVAHELNTPIQFVADSVAFVGDGLVELAGVLEAVDAVAAAVARKDPLGPPLKALLAARAAADLPYLRDRLPRAVERARGGLDRVAAIVRSMKELSHPGGDDAVAIDLGAAVRTAVTVCAHEHKYVADVALDLGELPPVVCRPGELQQVLVNLIVNAAHAIAAAGDRGRGTIRIAARRAGDDAVLEVTDDGCGIPDDVRARVFEPFFTTKEVGGGTGQGLALARAIVVDRHGGTIDLESVVGVGTTVRIVLPIAGRRARAPEAA